MGECAGSQSGGGAGSTQGEYDTTRVRARVLARTSPEGYSTYVHATGATAILVACLGLGACAEDGPGDRADLGYIDDQLSPADRVHWPGLDRAGRREIPFLTGFANGRPAGYWFLGLAGPETADVFFVCQDGDGACPLDEHRRIAWDRLIGAPLFSRVPGDPRYSPWWQVWTVRVPADHEPDSIRTIGTLFRVVGEGEARVERTIVDFGDVAGRYVGPRDAVVHAALVLRGTELMDNGGPMPEGGARRLAYSRYVGWRQGYRVELIDFSPSEGVLPAADDSADRPRMPSANIHIVYRPCDTEPAAEICDLPGPPGPRPVSEAGIGQDLTGDGSRSATNNILDALPCAPGTTTGRVYSPLWAVQRVELAAGEEFSLLDTTGDPGMSDLASVEDLLQAAADGRAQPPVPALSADGIRPLFFNCPSPAPEGFVPHPCAAAE